MSTPILEKHAHPQQHPTAHTDIHTPPTNAKSRHRHLLRTTPIGDHPLVVELARMGLGAHQPTHRTAQHNNTMCITTTCTSQISATDHQTSVFAMTRSPHAASAAVVSRANKKDGTTIRFAPHEANSSTAACGSSPKIPGC